MTVQLINIGLLPNDGSGDPLRVAFEKINNNFTQLSNSAAAAGPDGSVQYRATNSLKTSAYRRYNNTDVYIAIGSPNRWFKSNDTILWQEFAAPISSNINQIISVSTGFIAVGDNGAIVSSVDGDTWFTLTSGTTEDLWGIDFNTGSGIFTVVGSNGFIATSPNASTWTQRQAGLTTETLYSVTSISGQWVAVGSSGIVIGSANSTGWAIVNNLISGNLYSVTFVVGVIGSNFYAVGDGGAAFTSTDGVTWNFRSTGVTENLFSITGGNLTVSNVANTSTVVAVGANGTVIQTITTGLIWSQSTLGSNNLNDIVYTGNGLITVGNDGTVYSTNDAVTWTNGSIPGSLSGSANLIYDPVTGLSIKGNIVAQTNNTYNLGSVNNIWSTGYFSSLQGTIANSSSSQPNITSVGNLVSLTVTGNSTFTGANVSLGNVSNLHITGGSNLQFLQTDGTGNLTWANAGSSSNISNGNSNVNIATANGPVTISSAGNANIVVITGTGANISGTANITGNFAASGANVSLGAVANLHITGGTANFVLSTDGNGNLSFSNVSTLFDGNASPYIHFDVIANGNNQQFTNANIADFSNVYTINLFKDGVYLEPAIDFVLSNATTVQINRYLKTGSTIDILAYGPSLGSGSNGGGNGSPAGFSSQIQYNSSGQFAASANLTFVDTVNGGTLTSNNIVTSNTIANAFTSNNYILGNGVTTISTNRWIGASTTATGNSILYQLPAANVASIDYHVTSTDGTNSRQVSKLLAVNLGTTTNYAEYGGMWVGPQIVDIFVTQASGNIQLYSNAFTANNIQYNIVMTIYNN